MDLLDIIFPKYCINCRKIGDFLCSKCFSFLSFDVDKICAVCNFPSFDGFTHPKCKNKYTIDGVFSGISYKGVAKKMIIKFKYDPYLTGIKTVLSDLLYEGIIQKEEFHKVLPRFNRGLDSSNAILVPIPLYHARERKRVYNHAHILAQELSGKLNLSVIKVLKRIRNTKTQVDLGKEERKKNLKDAFEIDLKFASQIKGRQIFLVDDIFTTGSTLLEAGKVLKKNGAESVWGLTLARG